VKGRISEFLSDQIQRLPRRLPPERNGIPDLHLIVADPEINGQVRFALDNHGIITRGFELASHVAVAATAGPAAGHRSERTEIAFARTRSRRSHQGPCTKDDLISRVVRSDPGAEFVVEDLDGNS